MLGCGARVAHCARRGGCCAAPKICATATTTSHSSSALPEAAVVLLARRAPPADGAVRLEDAAWAAWPRDAAVGAASLAACRRRRLRTTWTPTSSCAVRRRGELAAADKAEARRAREARSVRGFDARAARHDVMLLFVDSVSRASFVRRFPRSSALLRRVNGSGWGEAFNFPWPTRCRAAPRIGCTPRSAGCTRRRATACTSPRSPRVPIGCGTSLRRRLRDAREQRRVLPVGAAGVVGPRGAPHAQHLRPSAARHVQRSRAPPRHHRPL